MTTSPATPTATRRAQHSASSHDDHHEMSPIETVKSLVIAFVLAMTFRGFVVEGFVIPTGSMAPTLLGEHVKLHSQETGYEYDVNYFNPGQYGGRRLVDPMLGQRQIVDQYDQFKHLSSMGDRILVLKCLYPFFGPKRFDVVVFKNPTDPNGDSGNYIKRLIGLPGEIIWLVDGDVFVTDNEDDPFVVQRKPEHIQRTMWQVIHNSDYIPIDPLHLSSVYRPAWNGDGWDTSSGRTYRTTTADPTALQWNGRHFPLADWTPYNMITDNQRGKNVADLRLSAAITPDADGLVSEYLLTARGHVFSFVAESDRATVRYKRQEAGEDAWIDSAQASIDGFSPGRATRIECWHVDQSMKLYVDGDCVVQLDYDWDAEQRLRWAKADPDGRRTPADLVERESQEPTLRWTFAGSPVSLRRVQLDRDVHYRVDRYNPRDNTLANPTQPGFAHLVESDSAGFGTSPNKTARLGPDHFFMLGDNSPSSRDSRLWGNPHPVVAKQIDPAPFVVNRKLLLGKAWMVYFPAPVRFGESKKAFIPDFGRLRFIR